MEWIEQIADSFVYFIPVAAVIGLLAVYAFQPEWRAWSERLFFACLLVVAGGTMRTMLIDDPGWLLHMISLGAMVVFPAVSACSMTRSESLEV
jgi:hypothetical protein